MLLRLQSETGQFIVLYFKHLKSMCLPCEYTNSYSEYKPKTYQKGLITLSFPSLPATSPPFLFPSDLSSGAFSLHY